MPLPAWRVALLIARAFFVFPIVIIAPAALANTVGGAPLIPEPMVFDMIRPLAAPRGELEVNTLGLFPIDAPGEAIDWAPEIEYAFADGFAVELELPFDNRRLTGFKLGLQGTFGTLADNKIVHGWQYLGIVDRDTGRLETSLLYIAGVRYNERWSSLTMVGFNLPNDVRPPDVGRDDALLFNHSLFYDVSRRTTLGLETNVRAGRQNRSWLIMPQLHQRIADKVMLQAGVGAQKPAGRAAHPSAALRVIKEF